MKLFIAEQRNAPFKLAISLDGNILELRFWAAVHVSEEEHIRARFGDVEVEYAVGDYLVLPLPLLDHRIDLTTLKNLPDFGDHASFLVYLPVGLRAENLMHVGGYQLLNLFAQTAGNKLSGPNYGSFLTGLHPVASINVPFKNSPIADYQIGINVAAEVLVEVGAGLEPEVCPGLDVMRNTALPKIWFDTNEAVVAPDGTVTLGFFVGDADKKPLSNDAEVYLDTTGGNLNMWRVRTKGGKGSVKLIADQLEDGDSVKVKCGFKYFQGTDDMFVKVRSS